MALLIRRMALDFGVFLPTMRAPMHSNYLNSLVLFDAALPQGSILSNRPDVPACASDDERIEVS
jgi:hypothetical protein